jgi:hypothetical protein
MEGKGSVEDDGGERDRAIKRAERVGMRGWRMDKRWCDMM